MLQTIQTLNKIDFSAYSYDELLEIQKKLTNAKETLKPKRKQTTEEINRKNLAVSLMAEILGFNAAYNRLKKRIDFEKNTIKFDEKSNFSFEDLGIENVKRFQYLMNNLKNITIFYNSNIRQISAQSLLNKLVNLCKLDEAKFSSLQRSKIEKK